MRVMIERTFSVVALILLFLAHVEVLCDIAEERERALAQRDGYIHLEPVSREITQETFDEKSLFTNVAKKVQQ